MDKFKKGLSAKGKQKWVAIANTALQQCKADGGADCEGRAVRIANSRVTEADITMPAGVFAIREAAVFDVGQSDFLIEGWQAGQDDHRTEAEIKEAKATADSKREAVVTLLREGPGNQFHNNYYKRTALETTLKLLQNRPKQYFNHAKDVDNPERDLRDWASSVVESWIENDTTGKGKLKARVKVFDNWLWDRAKMAPEQLAVSIEGRGSGQPEVIEGKKFNAIDAIAALNGVNWVDYPGNAGMGVQILESAQPSQQEETSMTLKEMLEQFKGLAEADKKAFIEANPELKEFFKPAPAAAPNNDQLAAVMADVKTMKESFATQTKTMNDKVTALEADKTRLANQLDAYQIKDQAIEKDKLIDGLLKASKLKDNHITETFKAQLRKVEAYKVGDKPVTEEEQMKQLIEDREKICVAEVATPGQPGASAGTEVAVEEQHRLFAINIFGVDPKVTEKKKEDEEVEA